MSPAMDLRKALWAYRDGADMPPLQSTEAGRGRNSMFFDVWRLYIMKTFHKQGKNKVFQNVSPKEKQIDV